MFNRLSRRYSQNKGLRAMLCSADCDPALHNTVWSRQNWQESSTLPNIARSRTPRRLTQHRVRLRPDEQQTTRCIYCIIQHFVWIFFLLPNIC